MKNKAIEIKDLVIDYGNSIAVNKINLEVEKGDLVTLLGPSGCGKSTTLNALAGLITSTSGKIYFDGTNVTKFSPKERDIGLVFQSYALYPHMTVYQNISFPLLANDAFKKEIEIKNKLVDEKILEFKYKLTGEKDFASLWKTYKTYQAKLDELKEEQNIINYKAKNAINNAKELPGQVKVRKEGRIKAAAEAALKAINKNDKKIAEVKKDGARIKGSDLSEEAKEKEINKLREAISKLESLNEKIYSDYQNKINIIKKEFKSEMEFAKSERKRIVSEVKQWKAEETQKINAKIEEFNASKKDDAIAAKEKIASSVSSLGEISSKDKEKIDNISSEKSSWKFELDKRVREVAERVGITSQLEKKVTNLSGGQQQRVAISRTLVKNPRVLLLDEPLSNLDAKMRVQTREWIRNLQQELGITTIFVTHDQEEAMSISDKIVCMSDGLIQQVDEPMEMYHNPANIFVAGFLGMPQMNFINHKTEIGKKLLKLFKGDNAETFGIRPEHVKNTKEVAAKDLLSIKLDGEVLITESFGREKLVTALFGKERIKFFTEDTTLDRGDKVTISFKKDKLYVFEKGEHGAAIGRI